MDDSVVPRVLVVDDEPRVLDTITASLRPEGYDVVAIPGATDVFHALQERSVDVVLTGLRFEREANHFHFSEINRRWPHVAAIVLTGYDSVQTAIEAVREGAYDYLVKPCDVDELKLTVARAVERVTLSRQLRDRISDLTAANARLQVFNDDVKAQVEAATAELSQRVQGLMEAKRSLEEAHHRREEFISMIAHELGQPLTMIGGCAQMLGRVNASPDARERARAAIVSQTRRLTRLVKDLSDATRLAAGSFSISPVDCDLLELVREQTDLARANAGNHSIRIDAPREPVTAVVDRDRIAQVLSNLLTNAIRYAPSGEIGVSLRVASSRAIVKVSDQGPGIPGEHREAIFHARVRLAHDGAEPSDGVGLGLFIGRGIAEAHGGCLDVESVVGGGTAFTLSLPLGPGE